MDYAQSFRVFDLDNSSTIDKQEFHEGLGKIGVDISDADLDAIWPLFCMDTSSTGNGADQEKGTPGALDNAEISKVEWTKFLLNKMDERSWSYKLTEDRFSHSMPDVEHHMSRTVQKVDRALKEKQPTSLEKYMNRTKGVAEAWGQSDNATKRTAGKAAKQKRRPHRQKKPPVLCGTAGLFRKIDIRRGRDGTLFISK
jgi:hypothetical protein